MTRATDDDLIDEREPSISLAEIAATLSRYRRILLVSIGLIGCFLIISGASVWLATPSRYLTSLPFQLEFEGAERGRYPNGTPFSASEVVAAPVLLSVFKANSLNQVMTFQEFRDSVFILESNQALEKLTREYRAKLSDPKLSAIDRERLEREFQEKRDSLAKDSYSLNYVTQERVRQIPATLRTKVLQDILKTWADNSIKKKGVALYDVPVLSSGIFERGNLAQHDYVIALDILRSNIERVIANIDQLSALPGAKVARTPKDRLSLAELRVQLEDTLRFRIQPLFSMILRHGLSRDPEISISFLESRLRFNELEQQEAEHRVAAIRDAITTYVQPSLMQKATPQVEAVSPSVEGDTLPQLVVPLLDQSFLKRMLELSSEQDDLLYRQRAVDRMREEALAVVPLEAEANYYRAMIGFLNEFKSRARPATQDERSIIENTLNQTRRDSMAVTEAVNQLYLEISSGLTPSTQLYSATVPATSVVERTVSFSQLLLFGVLLFIFGIIVTILGILVHARILRERGDSPSHGPAMIAAGAKASE